MLGTGYKQSSSLIYMQHYRRQKTKQPHKAPAAPEKDNSASGHQRLFRNLRGRVRMTHCWQQKAVCKLWWWNSRRRLFFWLARMQPRMLKTRVWGSSPEITSDSTNVLFSKYDFIHSFTLAVLRLCGRAALPQLRCQAAPCGGFSRCRAGSGPRAPERRLSSRGARARPFLGSQGLPGSGSEPVSPTAGRFFTTEPRGTPQWFLSTY